jgi:hypothetical protein
MNKKILATLSITVLLLIFVLPSVAYAWTAANLNLRHVGDYFWYNYDFESESASSTNVDWPMSVIFFADNDDVDVDSAKSLLWSHSGSAMHAKYYNVEGGFYDWDDDEGAKSAISDLNAWHARIYADTDTGQCTHDGWGYYVIASTHRDYLFALEYGYTNDANDHVCDKAADTLGNDAITDDFYNMYNYEEYREELGWGPLPDHIWDFDGWAEGIDMTNLWP